MRFGKMFRAIGPVVAMAAAGGLLAGCQGGKVSFDGQEGVPLSELDMGGEVPTEVVLIGPDHVVISQGQDFAISLQGSEEAKGKMRFQIDDGSLAIMRDEMSWDDWSDSDLATVNVTMPAPGKITVAGSGNMTVEALAPEAEAVIAGSGNLTAPSIAVQELEVSIAGSGNFSAGGTAERLELNIAGSGSARMETLTAADVEIDIAGSGNAILSSDGAVEANIMGSGNVTVRGGARCTVSSMGSGTLVCERREDEAA